MWIARERSPQSAPLSHRRLCCGWRSRTLRPRVPARLQCKCSIRAIASTAASFHLHCTRTVRRRLSRPLRLSRRQRRALSLRRHPSRQWAACAQCFRTRLRQRVRHLHLPSSRPSSRTPRALLLQARVSVKRATRALSPRRTFRSAIGTCDRTSAISPPPPDASLRRTRTPETEAALGMTRKSLRRTFRSSSRRPPASALSILQWSFQSNRFSSSASFVTHTLCRVNSSLILLCLHIVYMYTLQCNCKVCHYACFRQYTSTSTTNRAVAPGSSFASASDAHLTCSLSSPRRSLSVRRSFISSPAANSSAANLRRTIHSQLNAAEVSATNATTNTTTRSALESSEIANIEWLQKLCRAVANQQQQPFASDSRCFSALSTRADESGCILQSGARLVKASHYLEPLWSDSKENPYVLLIIYTSSFSIFFTT